MKKVAVVILNWNGKKLLEQFLPILLQHTPGDLAEVIIADNASSDDSLEFLREKYPDIRLIILDQNYGFAEGYNKALNILDHEYVVLLNSDVEVSPGWLTTAVEFLDLHPDVVALQPKLLAYKDKTLFEYAGASGGYMDVYGYPFCRGRVFDQIEKDQGQYDDVVEVLWATGACLFVRLNEYKEAGGLDTSFFAHQEEIDLCWRLVSRGRKIVCFPSSVVYHVGGATLAMEHPRKTFLNFRNNLLMLYKNLPDQYLKKVLFVRWFLDMLAAFVFLLKGYPSNANAVLKARREFKRNKKNYKSVRKENLSKSLSGLPEQIYSKSLIFAFHIKRKKTFNQLEFKVRSLQ